jgi:predicted TPR repeat methyltransferase
MEKHPSQKTKGDVATRHASVLLAKTPEELEAAYDKWATFYDEDVSNISGLPIFGHSAVKVLQKSCLPSKYPKLLDFGCGTGIAGPLLHEIGWNGKSDTVLHGCDLSQGMLDVSSSRGCYSTLIKSTFECSGAQHGLYDVIHASGIFAPGQAPPETFNEFVRLLKPGGMAFFTVRTGYYDGPEGSNHKNRLEGLCEQGKWQLASKSEEEYLPKEDVTCYVFCMKKL